MIVSIDIAANILDRGHVNLCLVQATPIRDRHVIEGDQPRGSTVRVLRDLLTGDASRHASPVLRELIPQVLPTIVLMPELAAGSPDWIHIDESVRSTARPLVLLVGFGATPGRWVLDWANRREAATSPTTREVAWNQGAQHGIAETRAVNGGWCWLHNFGGGTRCITFLKNHPEQSEEAVHFATLQYGNALLHLKFLDLDLFPLICADLVQPLTAGPDVAQSKLATFLQEDQETTRPILVAGLLMQREPSNFNWGIAIDSILQGVAPHRRVAFSCVNQAFGEPAADELVDRWRSLSGVFTRRTHLVKLQKGLPAGRPIIAGGIAGMLTRESAACVVAGAVAWPPYGPTTDAFVWHPDVYFPLNQDGIVSPTAPPRSKCTFELERFIDRFPSEPGWSPRVAAGLASIKQYLNASHSPTAQRVLDSILEGTERTAEHDCDLVGDHSVRSAIEESMHALAILVTLEGVDWQRNGNFDGQLQRADDTNLLVWRAPTLSGRAMRRALSRWMQLPGEHAHLIVIGEAARGTLAEGTVTVSRRDDLAEPPPSGLAVGADGALAAMAGDITEPRPSRSAACIRLARVADFYMEYAAADEPARLAALIGSLRTAAPRPRAEAP
ncbi:MAG: hypothetical protein JWO48_2706 [Bryobacterales bacterium]|nr:hypothetical protein [Bryobacterales bacterium]